MHFLTGPGIVFIQILTEEDFAKIKELQMKKKLLPAIKGIVGAKVRQTYTSSKRKLCNGMNHKGRAV